MLAEQFVGNMENGAADFTAGSSWDKPGSSSWEWDNVVMLSNHVNRKPPWGAEEAEPLLVSNLAPASSPMKLAKPEKFLPDSSASRSSANAEQLKPIPQTNSSANQQDFLLGLGGQDSSTTNTTTNNAGVTKVMKEDELVTPRQAQDAETGLKLGLKRSLTPPEGSNAAPNRGGSSTKSPGKRVRGSAHHTPRCQVEGCRTDLTSAKDYHRRHKVCAMHSKSAKVSVNSIEQRFCQQCSRFHVLSEFDEGKRSCRRRLAGHNERRRKPQPDPMQLTSALAPYQAGFMRLTRDDRIFGYGAPLSYLGLENLHGKLGWAEQSLVASNTGGFGRVPGGVPERFFMLFPQRKVPLLNGFGCQQQFVHQGTSSSMGQSLTLSSNSSGLYSGLGAAGQQVAAAAPTDSSGRALSLLSSQSWGAAATHDSMEQVLIPDSTKRYSGSGASPRGYGHQAIVTLEGTGGSNHGQGGSFTMPGGLGVNNYENNSVLTLLQESDYHHRTSNEQQQHSRPTINLMIQMSNQPHQHQPPQQQATPNGAHHISSYGSASIYNPHHL